MFNNDYTHTITRKPGQNFADGITTAGLGKPDFNKACRQHEQYCTVLQDIGLDVITLKADERYPDGCFVEDTAIVTDRITIITTPGDPSRRGEQKAIEQIMRGRNIQYIQAPGTVDGGDILRIKDHFFIGLSDRTNEEGAYQISEILKQAGFQSNTVAVRIVLHLKTGITYAGHDTIIGLQDIIEDSIFDQYKKIIVPAEEAYAANCLLINDTLIIPSGHPQTKAQLKNRGFFKLIETPMSEFEKMDGGLTCLSLPLNL